MVSRGLWHNKFVVYKKLRYFLLAIVLSIPSLSVMAQEKAQLPYSMVSSYQELFRSLAHLDLIDPSIMIMSTDPGVSSQSITFKLKIGEGWESFSPNENGVITFPEQPDWNDLILISDQPKGTLQLVIGFIAKPLASTNITYQELMALVPQFKEALAALADLQGQPAPDIKGLTIQLPEGSGAAVNILSQKRKKTLKSTKAGMVIMKYNKALWDENPPVVFDEMPVGIVPLQ
jgi:hypothetical protein